MLYHLHTNAFNGGEQSPLASERFDVASHSRGCRRLENFLPRIYGGVFRRPGMVHLGDAKAVLEDGLAELETATIRLVAFNYSADLTYVLELGHFYLRVWRDSFPLAGGEGPWTEGAAYAAGAYVMRGSYAYRCHAPHTASAMDEPGIGANWADYWTAHVPLEIATPWSFVHLRDIQWAQVNDLMYVTHPTMPPYRITRRSMNWWTCGKVEWTYPCLAPVNTSATTLRSLKVSGLGTTLTASTGVFVPEHVGAHFELAHRRPVPHLLLMATASATSGELGVQGEWRFTTYGTWGGVYTLEIQNIAGLWETYRSYSGGTTDSQARNITDSGTFDRATVMRMRFAKEGSGTPSGRGVLEVTDATQRGLVKVTGYLSPTQVVGNVVKELTRPADWVSGKAYVAGEAVWWTAASATYRCTTNHTSSGTNDPGDVGAPWVQDGAETLNWSEEAWSEARGYPRAVTFHQQRLIFGGTLLEPLTVWGSWLGDFENFQRRTLDDGGFSREIAAAESNQIQWLTSQKNSIVAGTAAEEWRITAGEATALTGRNFSVERQSATGSAHIQARLCGDAVIFAKRGGLGLCSFAYAYEADTWRPTDLTLMAEHVMPEGIRGFAFQQEPDPVLWVVTNDGKLVSMTYERDHQVAAWARHPTDGYVESVAVTYDGVYFAVNRRRLVDGAPVWRRTVERLGSWGWQRREPTPLSQGQIAYSDCCRLLTVPPVEGVLVPQTVFPGLGHLEGREVAVLADGAPAGTRTVVGGAITLDRPATRVVAGLPYESVLQPNKFELGLPDGSAQGRRFLCRKAVVRYWRSLGGEHAAEPGGERFPLVERLVETPLDEAQLARDGALEIHVDGRHEDSVDLTLYQGQPLPLNVLALTTQFVPMG